MTKNWIGLSLAAVALVVSASAGFACDQQAADAKDAKGATDDKALAANGTTKGCDMPCCAHAKEAANEKTVADAAAEKPCSAHAGKGCPKKAASTATAAAKAEPAAEPAKDASAAEPAPNSGTHR